MWQVPLSFYAGPDDFDRWDREERRKDRNDRRRRAKQRCTCCGAPVECDGGGRSQTPMQTPTPRPLTAADVIVVLKDAKQGPQLRAALFDALQDDITELVNLLTAKDANDDPRATREGPSSGREHQATHKAPPIGDDGDEEAREDIPF